MSDKEECEILALLPLFNEQFPDEDSCFKVLIEASKVNWQECSRCEQNDFVETADPRHYECTYCGAEYPSFVGTVFHRVLRVREWFAGFWYAQKRVKISANRFHLIFQVAYSTADRIKKTVGLFLDGEMVGVPEAFSQVFLELFCRRSSETPANAHPSAEQLPFDRIFPDCFDFCEPHCDQQHDHNYPDSQSLDGSANTDLLPGEKAVLEQLSEIAFQTIDELIEKTKFDFSDLVMTITSLQFKGLVESNQGNSYKLINQAEKRVWNSVAAMAVIAGFIAECKKTWQRISRKYLQLYLAWYWNSLREESETIGFWSKVARFEMPTPAVLQGYSSPARVRIPAVDAA